MNELLPNTDNLFRYFLTIGVFLIVFSVLYPMQKQHQIQIDKNKLDETVAKVELEINSLLKQRLTIERAQDSIERLIHILKVQSDANPRLHDSLRAISVSASNFHNARLSLYSKVVHDLSLLVVSEKFENERIKLLEQQMWQFFWFRIVFIVFGIIFSIAGLRFWISAAYLEDRIKADDRPLNHKTYYVRTIDYCRANKILTVSLFVMVFCILTFLFRIILR